jgi:hypothetical protein
VFVSSVVFIAPILTLAKILVVKVCVLLFCLLAALLLVGLISVVEALGVEIVFISFLVPWVPAVSALGS